MASDDALLKTPLHALHQALGARMVPFAGYDMPVQYPAGIIKEHQQTRSAAGLFDVSHMGQVRLVGAQAAAALERLVPGDIAGLAPGRMRYTQLTTDGAGILDDLMVTRREGELFLVVNAARKHADLAHLQAGLGGDIAVVPEFERALMALQGPQAEAALQRVIPGVAGLSFMTGADLAFDGVPVFVTRSGYTGEDGFEIALPADRAEALARRLLDQPEVAPVGLGARDSLRLEAGLCLYGHDIDETTNPVEAGLAWSIGKRRRAEGGFPGAALVQRQLADGPERRRVGLRTQGRAPVREGAALQAADGAEAGRVTSGGFGPSVDAPVAMGYVPRALAAPGTPLSALVRGRQVAMQVCPLPFVPHRYKQS